MADWIQIAVATDRTPDEALLLERVDPLIERLRPALLSWHFFWEPDLWVRLHLGPSADRAAVDAAIAAAFDGLEWRIEDYGGDAPMMGEEMWERCERDFQNGAEHAVALARHARDGTLSRDRDFHWTRHVHTTTNQLTGSWAEEARLSARQLRYRAWLLSRVRAGDHRADIEAMLTKIDEVLASIDVLRAAEDALLAAWRAAGRPPVPELVELPEWFDYDPERAMGPRPNDG